jgi:hypothetical protein
MPTAIQFANLGDKAIQCLSYMYQKFSMERTYSYN